MPANHKGQDFLKGIAVIAISWIVGFIAYGSFMENWRHIKIEELLIGHIISNTFSNVFVPSLMFIAHQIFANMQKNFLSSHLCVCLIKCYHFKAQNQQFYCISCKEFWIWFEFLANTMLHSD